MPDQKTVADLPRTATVTEHVAMVSAVTAGISADKNACQTIAKMAWKKTINGGARLSPL